MTDEQLKTMTDKLTVIDEKVTRVDKHITGNGNPKSGLLWRVDAIEAQNGRQAKAIGAVGLGLLTTVGGWLASKFTGTHP